jgi:ribosomal protein S18 acetylase RimI-like enzyme
MKMKIVKASNSEIQDIAKLNSFGQRIHNESYPDIFKPIGDDSEVEAYVKKILKQESNHLFVAYKNDVAVGYVWAAIINRPDSAFKYHRRYIFIHQIVVHEKYRKQNIGKSLFKEIENIANGEGIHHFELDSWAFNTDAHIFFKKLGFATYNIKMWRKPN